jgi:hypothetical protein
MIDISGEVKVFYWGEIKHFKFNESIVLPILWGNVNKFAANY